jgi:cold shock CspA family protein
MQYQGEITHWQDEKGIGFITPTDSIKDVYVTAISFQDQGRRPRRGDRVSFGFEADYKGRLFAKQVHYLKAYRAQNTFEIFMMVCISIMLLSWLM